MSKKTALLFVDDECIKVAYGVSIKVVKFQDMSLDYNVRFFDKLFEEWNVIVVESVAPLNKQGLYDFVGEIQNKPAAPVKQASQSTMVRSQEPSAKPVMEVEDDCMLFRFIGQSIVCVDDVPTGEDFAGMPGVKQTLVIKPDQAINLGKYDPEKVRNSPILKRLIRRGSLVPCTPDEADEMIIRADQRNKAENDARMDRAARMVPPGMKAEDYAERIRRGASMAPDDEIETIEVTDDAPRVSAGSVRSTEELLEISSNLSTDQLMRLAGASEDGEADIPPPPPRRQLAPRPVAESVGMTGRTTRRL